MLIVFTYCDLFLLICCLIVLWVGLLVVICVCFGMVLRCFVLRWFGVCCFVIGCLVALLAACCFMHIWFTCYFAFCFGCLCLFAV